MTQFPPGTQFGPYRISRSLGFGGMGAVYAAIGPSGVEVALKVLAPGGSAEDVTRFHREAEAHARADTHSHVARVHSAGQVGPHAYLVMDLLPGGDLKDRLRTGPLPAEEARALGVALASGLAHVHAQGVLHRDIKPANVLFDETGSPRLTDFGLARSVEVSDLTQSGVILGTPGFMAPEQAGVGKAGIATDVFGLGATLYAALTGHPPFSGASTLETLTKLMTEAPPPLPQSVPPDLRAAVERALEKDPAARFPDAASFGAALQGTPPRAGIGAGVWLGLLILLAALAATAGFVLRPDAEPDLLPQSTRSSPAETRQSPTPKPILESAFDWKLGGSPLVLAPGEAPEAPYEAQRVTVTWLSNKRFVSLADNGVFKFWEPGPKGLPISTLVQRTTPITLGASFPRLFGHGTQLASGSPGQPLRILLIDGGGLRREPILIEPKLQIMAQTPVSDDRYLLFGAERVVLWRLGSKKFEWTQDLDPPPEAPDSSPNGAFLLDEEGQDFEVLLAWSPNKPAHETGLAPHLERLRIGNQTAHERLWIRPTKGRLRAFLSFGGRLLCGDDVGVIREAATPDQAFVPSKFDRPQAGFVPGAHSGTIRGIALGPRETLISLGSRVPDLRIWNEDRRLLETHVFKGELRRGTRLVVSPDRRLALVQGESKIALVPTEVR